MFNEERNRWKNVYLKDYGIHYSRIIASWTNVGGDVHSKMFDEWLRSLTDSKTGDRILTDEQVGDICRLARNGKLEWQSDAFRFIEEHK